MSVIQTSRRYFQRVHVTNLRPSKRMEVHVWPGATGTLPCAHRRWVAVRTPTPSISIVCSYCLDIIGIVCSYCFDVVNRYGGIRSLNLVAVHELQSSHICALLPRLTTLTALDLSHNPLMDDEVGQSISANCASQLVTSTAKFTIHATTIR
jgi:hypothetical protein